jgi:hypothetical protein
MLGLALRVLFERRFQGAAADVITLRDNASSRLRPGMSHAFRGVRCLLQHAEANAAQLAGRGAV